jgi:acetyl/propionyl-CoA carboxylase alpha subunit
MSRRPAILAMRPMTGPFGRVLVANRGEIAVRIIRACHDLGMEAVAVFSDADADALHVRLADAAVRIGPPPAAESYLRSDAVISAARATNAAAIHPGYGFLAERASFAADVIAAGIAYVGPDPETIALLGDKLAARRLADSQGVPVVPGTLRPAAVDRPDAIDAILAEAERVGFPMLVKASAGGGGRGMRRVAAARELPEALSAGSREAEAAFGDGSVYLEREIRPARHIEVQLIGDAAGTIVALGERDCSIQRRHQKLVEEAPAPGLDEGSRRHLHDLAVTIARAARLRNAATAEFLYDTSGAFWFLEVNTRLQVEHGVTELVTGLDLVAEQLRIAGGAPLGADVRLAAEAALRPGRHAIEVRVSAEDPARDFAPVPGRIGRWVMPSGPSIRVDTAVEGGERVPPDYDPLVAKIMAVGPDRATAIARLRRALDEVEIGGIQSTLPFHRFVARSKAFARAELSTDWVVDNWDGPARRSAAAKEALITAGLLEGAPGAPRTRPSLATHRAGPAGGNGLAGPVPSGAGSAPSPWRVAGRETAIDRSPR